MKGEAIEVLDGSPAVSDRTRGGEGIISHFIEIFSDPDSRHQRAGLPDSDAHQPGGRRQQCEHLVTAASLQSTVLQHNNQR